MRTVRDGLGGDLRRICGKPFGLLWITCAADLLSLGIGTFFVIGLLSSPGMDRRFGLIAAFFLLVGTGCLGWVILNHVRARAVAARYRAGQKERERREAEESVRRKREEQERRHRYEEALQVVRKLSKCLEVLTGRAPQAVGANPQLFEAALDTLARNLDRVRLAPGKPGNLDPVLSNLVDVVLHGGHCHEKAKILIEELSRRGLVTESALVSARGRVDGYLAEQRSNDDFHDYDDLMKGHGWRGSEEDRRIENVLRVLDALISGRTRRCT